MRPATPRPPSTYCASSQSLCPSARIRSFSMTTSEAPTRTCGFNSRPPPASQTTRSTSSRPSSRASSSATRPNAGPHNPRPRRSNCARLFQQTHYAGHDKEKTDDNAQPPREIDEHPQATLTRLVKFSEPLLGEVRAKAPQRKPTTENHQNRASHHKQNDFAMPTADGESHEAHQRR